MKAIIHNAMKALMKSVILVCFSWVMPAEAHGVQEAKIVRNEAEKVLPDLTNALPSERFFGKELAVFGHRYFFATSDTMDGLRKKLLKSLGGDWEATFGSKKDKSATSTKETERGGELIASEIFSSKNHPDIKVRAFLYNIKKYGETFILKLQVSSRSRLKRVSTLPAFDQLFADQKEVTVKLDKNITTYVYLTKLNEELVRMRCANLVKQGWEMTKPVSLNPIADKEKLAKKGIATLESFVLVNKKFQEFRIGVSLVGEKTLKDEFLITVVVKDSWGNKFYPVFGHKSQSELHVRAILSREIGGFSQTYAENVILMPGHEFLKKRYNISGLGRDKPFTTKRVVLTKAMSDAMNKREPLSEQDKKERSKRTDERMKQFRFEMLEVKEGDFVTDPSDLVGTPDGKLHFQIKKGDVLYKVVPPRGDFLLLQLREVEKGLWKVVAEYWD